MNWIETDKPNRSLALFIIYCPNASVGKGREKIHYYCYCYYNLMHISLGQVKLISSLAGLTHNMDAGSRVLILFFMIYLWGGRYLFYHSNKSKPFSSSFTLLFPFRNMEQVVLEMGTFDGNLQRLSWGGGQILPNMVVFGESASIPCS